MNKLLALSALGPDGPNLVQDFAAAILDSGCNILESRVTRLGSETGIQMLVAGNWRTVARLEQTLPALAGRLNIEIQAHAAVPPDARDDMLPYAIDLVSMDQPGIVYRVVKFLAQRGVRITDLSTSSYTAQQTGASMVSLRMSIAIPATIHIATLREDFLMLCDELNLDAVLEPIKG